MATISLKAYNREIEQLIDNKQLDEALAHCRHILKSFPKHIDTYRLMGRAYLEQQDSEKAADVFQRVLSSVPDDFISNIGMSIIKEVEGNLDEAIMHMQLASETQPSNPAVMDELRRLFGLRDGIEPAKLRLTRGALARMYIKGELYQQAAVEIRAALSENPERVDLKLLLAKISEKIGNKSEAIELAQKIVEKFPHSYDANLLLANLLSGGSHDQDAQAYRKIVNSLDPYATYKPIGVESIDQLPEEEVSLEWFNWSSELESVEIRPEVSDLETQFEAQIPDGLEAVSETQVHETGITLEDVGAAGSPEMEDLETDAQPGDTDVLDEILPEEMQFIQPGEVSEEEPIGIVEESSKFEAVLAEKASLPEIEAGEELQEALPDELVPVAEEMAELEAALSEEELLPEIEASEELQEALPEELVPVAEEMAEFEAALSEEDVRPEIEAGEELLEALPDELVPTAEELAELEAMLSEEDVLPEIEAGEELLEAIPDDLGLTSEEIFEIEEEFISDDVLPLLEPQDELNQAISEGLDALEHEDLLEEISAPEPKLDQAGLKALLISSEEIESQDPTPEAGEKDSEPAVDIPDWVFSDEGQEQPLETLTEGSEAAQLADLPDKLSASIDEEVDLEGVTNLTAAAALQDAETAQWLDAIEEPEFSLDDTRPSKTRLASIEEPGALPDNMTDQVEPSLEAATAAGILQELAQDEGEGLPSESQDTYAWLEDLDQKEDLVEEEFLFSGTEQAEVTPDWVLEDSTVELPEEFSQSVLSVEEIEELDRDAEAILDEINEVDLPEKVLLGEETAPDSETSDWVNLDALEDTRPIAIETGQSAIVQEQVSQEQQSIGMVEESEEALIEAESELIQVVEEALPEESKARDEASLEETLAPTGLVIARQALLAGDSITALQEYNQEIKAGNALPEIITDLEKAVQERPESFEIWQALGDAYLRSDQLQKALEAYTKAEDLLA